MILSILISWFTYYTIELRFLKTNKKVKEVRIVKETNPDLTHTT
jgi:peptidoglycan/LPS O-acetylase OafA/YrhL